MANWLLARQVSLVTYLTSDDVIFGCPKDKPLDPLLDGIDPALLHLEARFSHDKRMEKIAGLFSRTFALLGGDRTSIERGFAKNCPPISIGRLDNARQFRDFLSKYWGRQPPKLRYLPDLAACELAIAEARSRATDAESAGAARLTPCDTAPRGSVRRAAGVVLLRCAHDVRAVFDGSAAAAAPARRDMALAVATPRGATEPEIFELDPTIFDLLAALNTWTDRSLFGRGRRSAQLVSSLARCGLLEENR